MEYDAMLRDSFRYTKEALWGRWSRWLLLLVGMIVFPLDYGYLVRVMRGQDQPPEFDNLGELFVDGLKMFVVYFVYVAIGYGILLALMIGASVIGGVGSLMSLAAALVGCILLFCIVFIVQMAIIRFSRSRRMSEAFNVSEILGHIGRIGWGAYILSQIVLWIALCILMIVPVILFIVVMAAAIVFFGIIGAVLAYILFFALVPAAYIFTYRYNTLVYDSARIGL